jgi:hypothetical protein
MVIYLVMMSCDGEWSPRCGVVPQAIFLEEEGR